MKLAEDVGEHGLRRALGVWGATAFVVTNMVGTGIFTVPAFVISAVGNGLEALGVWLVGGGLALSGALCYAELATRMPAAGGEYFYLTRIYGRLVGFLSGWISFLVGFSAAIAAAALGAAAYASTFFPGWDRSQPLIEGLGVTQGGAVAAGLVALLAVFHSAGVRPSGRLQTVMAALVIGSILLFVAAGVGTGRGDWGRVTQEFSATGFWWVALIQVSFAYSGWNAATYLAGEVVDPRRTLPRALIGGTLAVVLLYLSLNLLFLYAIPVGEWAPTITVGTMAAERLFGPVGASIVSAMITVAILGSVSAMTAAGPRVYYAMAKDGLAPAVFGRLHGRSHVPVAAIIAQAVASMILAVTGAFESLLTYVGSALLLLAGVTVAAVYRLPRPEARDEGRYFRTPGYPVTPAIFLVLMAVAWFQGLKERPVPTGAALLTIVAGVVIYYLGSARGWFTEAEGGDLE